MTPQLRRTGIYDEIEAVRVREDATCERVGVTRFNSPDFNPLDRIDHMKALIGQLPTATTPDVFLRRIASACVAWMEAIDEVRECKIDVGSEAA
jgi:hypothetical protein